MSSAHNINPWRTSMALSVGRVLILVPALFHSAQSMGDDRQRHLLRHPTIGSAIIENGHYSQGAEVKQGLRAIARSGEGARQRG